MINRHPYTIYLRYLHRDIQVDYEVFARGGSEQQIEVTSRQPQGLVDVFGNQNVAVGWNRSPDPEHCALQGLVLKVPFKDNDKVTHCFTEYSKFLHSCVNQVKLHYHVCRHISHFWRLFPFFNFEVLKYVDVRMLPICETKTRQASRNSWHLSESMEM